MFRLTPTTFMVLLLSILLMSCKSDSDTSSDSTDADSDFQWQVDRFGDVRVLNYQIPGFDRLSLDQKKLVYYLVEAGLEGRDIMYDQNYRHNLEIRQALDAIIENHQEDDATENWENFLLYAKRVYFSNGIHHHYSMDKHTPVFDQAYFQTLLDENDMTMSEEALKAIFDPAFDNKKVNLNPDKGLLKASAVNFYDPNITADEAEAFYKEKSKGASKLRPLSYGLNSKLVKDDADNISEMVYKVDGLYGGAIKEIIGWLEKAQTVAESDAQKAGFGFLIDYYTTGDLDTWDKYNIAWVRATEGDIDYINSFIEVYNDPLGYKGSYENIVEIKDFDASERMAVLAENAQYFEDNAPIKPEHKKENVVGVSYKVVSVAGESGDASPATPIGVNLPNANWIRAAHGSKSVSLGNIINAYSNASGGGLLKEFAHDEEEIARIEEYGELADKMGTALHEVIGHASGKINEGVGTPKETLKSYASTLEEARADIVALYYIMDPKLEELGLIPSKEAGMAEYDSYIANGMMKQLQRIELGKEIEESHMRNRQLIASWAYEKGMQDTVIQKIVKDGKTYFDIQDYDKLRAIFGELHMELQRVKSEGDYAAGKALVENYGVKVDPAIHKEVLDRVAKLDIAPYSGFVNPVLKPVMEGDSISDIEITYPAGFLEQMLDYAGRYGNL